MTSLKKVGTRRKFWKEPKPYLVAEAWNYFFLPKEVPILENINCHIFSAQRLRHRKISRSWCTDNVARYVPPFHNILFPDLQNCITFPNCFLRVFVSVALFIVVPQAWPRVVPKKTQKTLASLPVTAVSSLLSWNRKSMYLDGYGFSCSLVAVISC